MERQMFDSMYKGRPPWDSDAAQPAFVRLADEGKIQGTVLDVGCGTGEIALFLASRGHEVWGIDFVPVAIEMAKKKAQERKLPVHFQVGDALKLSALGRQFDTVTDCGLFHTFSDEERPVFVRELASVLRPGDTYFMACFSEDEPGSQGPRRVSQQEIRKAFQKGWHVKSIDPIRFETVETPGLEFSPGGPKAWLATIVRSSG